MEDRSDWIEITTKVGCKNRCEYCPQSKLIKKYKLINDEIFMSFDTFKMCISTIPKEIQIHFTGFCEPFLNPLTIDFIEYSIQQKYQILINTMLTGVKKKYIDRLKVLLQQKLWPGPLTIHLPCNEYNSTIITKNYYEILGYTIETLEEVNFHIHGTPIKEVDNFIKSIRGEYFVKRRGIHSRAGNVKLKDISLLPKKMICHRIKDHVLLPNGDVVLCCVDYGLEEILGNLKEMSYQELHLTDKFKEIKKNGSLLCRKCEF